MNYLIGNAHLGFQAPIIQAYTMGAAVHDLRADLSKGLIAQGKIRQTCCVSTTVKSWLSWLPECPIFFNIFELEDGSQWFYYLKTPDNNPWMTGNEICITANPDGSLQGYNQETGTCYPILKAETKTLSNKEEDYIIDEWHLSTLVFTTGEKFSPRGVYSFDWENRRVGDQWLFLGAWRFFSGQDYSFLHPVTFGIDLKKPGEVIMLDPGSSAENPIDY